MTRNDAHAFAASLATTLMVSIVVFRAGDGTYGAIPTDEIDGDELSVISEIDPYGLGLGLTAPSPAPDRAGDGAGLLICTYVVSTVASRRPP